MADSKNQIESTSFTNANGSIRMNLDNPKIRDAILKQVQLARQIARERNK